MRFLVVIALVACGGGTPKPRHSLLDLREVGTAKLLAASARGDARAIGELLGAPLVLGGMWFPDTTCRRTFSGSGLIQAAARETFAKCLAMLRLTKSERSSEFPEVAVLTYEPGIEIEAQFAQQDPTAPPPFDRATEIRWIGYVGRAGKKDALPTVTQRVLEATRTAPIAFDDETRAALDAELAVTPGNAYAWFKLCIDVAGAVTGVHPRMVTSLAVHDVLSAIVKQWTFQPFLLDGQATPVCSLVRVDYPSPSRDAKELVFFPLPVPETHEGALFLPANRKRLSGTRDIAPDDDARTWIRSQGITSVEARFMYCTDVSGKVDQILVVKPSGVPRYDAKIVKAIGTWRFAPATYKGRTVKTCTHSVFRYVQK